MEFVARGKSWPLGSRQCTNSLRRFIVHKMSNLADTWTLVVSFLVHIIFLVSIFDIYFRSPIIVGIEPVKNDGPALAKRLVLFSADGLRADKFYELQSRESLYLRHIIDHRGRWGVGHAAPPTESRPGHVGIIAGFNEDPSAIFKGWKVNPVEFDSVFNRSVATFGWGSPDILLMFCEESNRNKMFMNTFSTSYQDFSGVNASAARQSLWAFENFKIFLQKAKSSPELLEKLHQDGVIFFLHLLGTDTSGHSHKPHSEVYTENIRIIDGIVKQTEMLINEFYKDDNKSVFLFTADHGMSDWGSHGEASRSETEVPLVTWGSGILGPKQIRNSQSPISWNLNHLERLDVNQNDLAPLMSVLLGIPIPINSLGSLPADILNCSIAEKSSALLLNAQQMLAQFNAKRKLIEDTTLKLVYKPFAELSDGKDFKILQTLKSQFRDGQYELVISGSRDLFRLCLAGLSFYHNYYQKLLLFCISFSYIGWICWLLLRLSTNDVVPTAYYELWSKRKSRLFLINCLFIALISLTILLLAVQCLPYQYYLYCCLPSVIWWSIFRKLTISHFALTLNYSYVFTLLSTIIGTELSVISFFERETLSVVLFFIMLWPLIAIKKKASRNIFFVLWILSCISIMAFPFLPVLNGKPNNTYIILSTILWWVFIIASWIILSKMPTVCNYSKSVPYFSAFLVLFAVTLMNVLYVSFTSTINGLLALNQFVSWAFMFFVPMIPVFSTRKLVLRLLYIYFALGIVSLLFSINHDAMFSPLFSFHLFLWFLVENIIISDQNNNLVSDFSRTKFSRVVPQENNGLRSSDLRRAFLFFYYTVLSFFGVGNIASINSFDPRWVRCFISLFAPYTITVLILVKVTIPFILTACTFRAVNDISKVLVDKIFLVVLIYCDIMGLNFLFLVKNVGSWLRIGSSVSHYVISQTITLFLVLLYFLSGYLTSTKLKKTEHLWRSNEVPSKTA